MNYVCIYRSCPAGPWYCLPKGYSRWAPPGVRAVAARAVPHAGAHTWTTIERRFAGCRASSRRMMKRPLPLSGEEQCPHVLRHLQRLTRSFVHEGQWISYIHVYACPVGPGREPPLTFITAQDSGVEGIACVDDAARAAILALRVHEETGSAAALRLARDWFGFVTYMP